MRSSFRSTDTVGTAITFIIRRAVEKDGIFPRDAVSTLCRLADWSEGSGVWAMYVKDFFERCIDTSGPLNRYEEYTFFNVQSVWC